MRIRSLTFSTTLICFALGLSACPKSEDVNKGAPAASGSAAAQGTAALLPTTTDGGAAADRAARTSTSTSAFAGTYSVAPRAMYIPESKDWSSVKQAKDDPSKHVGEGTLSVTVEAGRVTGTVDTGPASPALLDGTVIEDELRGTVRRKDPKDDGLTGTFIGKLAGDSVTGTLSLAEANAAVVREGKVSLKKK